MQSNYIIGIDYGTDSCRALIVNLSGEEIASSVKYYPRWKQGLYCDQQKNQYRQHPLDYIESFEQAVKEALSKVPEGTAEKIVGMAFDTTGSTPALTDTEGMPLALLDEFKDNPNAMFVLWKDHTAIKEAGEINRLCKEWEIDYTSYSGGIYSSEWVWSKMLHVLREDESIRKAAYSWTEHCDWMPALLTGKTKPEEMIRSRCAAGHKAMWNALWDGLPSEEFLTTLSPLLAGFRSHLFTETFPSDKKVGTLTAEWAERLGLPENTVVGVGAIDCHMGAVGAGIKPGTFVRVMGTSTCDVMVIPYKDISDKLILGICGQVDGSVVPGMIGLEAGQAAFGDLYAWFKEVVAWPLTNILSQSSIINEDTKEKLIAETLDKIIPVLSEQAAKVNIEDSMILATDWFNGRRTPDANQLLKGTITGLTLGSTAPLVFRALVEATAFGSRSIVEHFIKNDIDIKEVIAIGGISLKSPFVMQTLSDVLNMPIKVAKSEQACALGACMFAAVAAGIYPDIEEAQKHIEQGFTKIYNPDPNRHIYYSNLYNTYLKIGKFSESII